MTQATRIIKSVFFCFGETGNTMYTLLGVFRKIAVTLSLIDDDIIIIILLWYLLCKLKIEALSCK